MPGPHPLASRPTTHERGRGQRKLRVERLEDRLLMTASSSDPYGEFLSHGNGLCNCPICSGQGIEALAAIEQATTTGNASTSYQLAGTPTGVPQLSSRPGAKATLYLDFDGHFESSWGSHTGVYTPAYDLDGNHGSFNSEELAAIREIWARVAEDYAPFNINITTVAPSSMADRVSARIAIGGSYSDWFGNSAGGVAYVGGFYNGAPNVGYVFEDALGNGNPRYTAEAASHEAGHLFGLSHQAVWSGGNLVEEYNSGNGNWAPIMGVGYYADRTTWHRGPTSNGPSSYQDDLSILAGSTNGIGYVSDDYGNTPGGASSLPLSGSSVNVAGLIGRNDDRDVFRFSTAGGAASFAVSGSQLGANLDSVLEVLNSAGQVIASSNPATSLGASIAKTLASGTYYLVVRSSGGYGNLGQYKLTGSVASGSTYSAPDIQVANGTSSLSSGGALAFGTTTTGTSVSRTVTVTNRGGGTLNLQPIGTLPSGYSLVSNLADTTLTAGQSTTFTVKLNATTTGSFSGTLRIASNDPNQGSFYLSLSGSVRTASSGTTGGTGGTSTGGSGTGTLTRIIDNGGSGFTTSGSWKRATGAGRESDLHSAASGSGSAVAQWTFTGLQPGQYRVAATWPGSRMYASDAPFTIYGGSQRLGTIDVNQQRPSSTFSDSGSSWQNLGTFTIQGNTLTVRLTNQANGRVIADAIRIERVYSTSGGTAFRSGAPLPYDPAKETPGEAESAEQAGSVIHGIEVTGSATWQTSAEERWQATYERHAAFAMRGSAVVDASPDEELDALPLPGDLTSELLTDLALVSLLEESA